MRAKYRMTWFGLILMVFVISAACGLIGNIGEIAEQAGGARGTIEGLVTQAGDFTTQAAGFATEASESGLMETAQAMATSVDSADLMGTMEAMRTQFPGGFEDIQATAMAMAEEFNTGEPPEDIPLIEPEDSFFFANDSFVSYTTNVDFASVRSFYEEEMPLNGWAAGETNIQTGSVAVLQFTKQGRDATVSITVNPTDDSTLVGITITGQ